MKKLQLLIIGYGRLGQAFYRLYHSHYEIRGVKRTPLPEDPCQLALMPIQSDTLRPHLRWADVVIFCPATGRAGSGASGSRGSESDFANYRETYLGNMEFVLGQLKHAHGSLRCFILIGSTGVYPRSQGGSWTEDRTIPVETPRQEILLLMEQALIQSGFPAVILRCGGLYGEGRENFSWVGRRKELLSSQLSDDPMTLVHQDDVCDVIQRVIEQQVVGQIFNVRDDSTVSPKTLFMQVAAQSGVPLVKDGHPPPAVNRHIPNAKLKHVLGYQFHRQEITAYVGHEGHC